MTREAGVKKSGDKGGIFTNWYKLLGSLWRYYPAILGIRGNNSGGMIRMTPSQSWSYIRTCAAIIVHILIYILKDFSHSDLHFAQHWLFFFQGSGRRGTGSFRIVSCEHLDFLDSAFNKICDNNRLLKCVNVDFGHSRYAPIKVLDKHCLWSSEHSSKYLVTLY